MNASNDAAAERGRGRGIPEEEPEVLRGLRRHHRGDLRAAPAWRPRDPDRRAADPDAAREEQRARGASSANSSPTAPRTTRSAKSSTARRWRCSRAPDLETTLAVLYHSLKEDFAVPQVAARLWGKVPEQSYLPELAATSTEIREYADQLGHPYCGPAAAFESREWFEDGDALQSFAFMPLRTAQTFGLLALGSPDAQRFHAGHGHAVPDAPRGTGECRHRALPAAVLAIRRDVAKPVTKRTVVAPPPRSDTARNAALLDAFATHLATRPAHTRDAYLARLAAARRARRRHAASRADARAAGARAGDAARPGTVGPQPGADAVGVARVPSLRQ